MISSSRGGGASVYSLPLLLLLATSSTHAFVQPPTTAFFHPTKLHSSSSVEPHDYLNQDPASTTPQLLSSLWHMISTGCSSMTRGQELTVLFPNMQPQLSDPNYVEKLLGHINYCKDVCDDFGISTLLIFYPPPRDDGTTETIQGFTVKSYKAPGHQGDENNDDTGGYKFTNDEFWDDDLDISFPDDEDHKLDDDDDDLEDNETWNADLNDLPPIPNEIPDSDEEIISTTKSWVNALMSDMGVCPFTSGPNLAGLPMGNVYYTLSRNTQIEDMYATYWDEVVRLESQPQDKLSTTLLIAPKLALENIELFENFCNTLTQPLEPLEVERLIQLVFFHPQWVFRDGGQRSGAAKAANYARRSPWPMINILRTKQVRAAQKGIPTGLVYQQNERTLEEIGATELERMLRLRDWSKLEGRKVDRKQMEALRVARDMQDLNQVKVEDTKMEFDPTPAVNKVDRKQIEGGDMVNVIQQAVEKRLELGKLTSAETSATLMASDFLMEELDKIIQKQQHGSSVR